MPPPPPPPLVAARYQLISAALHTLIINVFLMVLVFMETAAGRGDNDTLEAAPPSGAPDRPVVRLWIHGVCFLLYLFVKAIQLTMPDSWYPFNRHLDELSLGLGIISLVALICSITFQFVGYAVAPFVVTLFCVRFWWGDKIYEWLYLASIWIYKSMAFVGRFLLYLKAHAWNFFSQPQGYQPPEDQQERERSITNAANALESSMRYWNRELLLANLRRDAAAQVAKEIADDEMAAHNAGLTYAQAVIDAKAAVGYIPRPAAQPTPAQPAAAQPSAAQPAASQPAAGDPRDIPAVPAPQP